MTPRVQTILLSCCILVGAGILIGWNSGRFLTAKPTIREKNLDFLPAPETARILALGHTNTAAKLRWIDSFAYFQYQLDRKDDRVEGGGSGFQRLYDTLIELDPKFQPFYEHAALNTSGILSQHGVALGFLLRGTMELPHSSEMWRNVVVTLKVFFKWDERHPLLFDAFLAAWEQHELDPMSKRMVWDWKNSFGTTMFSGLEQLPYWLTQLELSAPNSATGNYVENTIRELLARYGAQELTALMATWRISQGAVPQTLTELIDNLALINPLQPLPKTTPTLTSLAPLLDPSLLQFRYPQGLSPFGPIAVGENGRPLLKNDPYGLPWQIEHVVKDGKDISQIISPGQARVRIDKMLAYLTSALLSTAQKEGHWPTTLEEVTAMGITLPPVPDGCTVRLDGRELVATWDVEPQAPWPLRKSL